MLLSISNSSKNWEQLVDILITYKFYAGKNRLEKIKKKISNVLLKTRFVSLQCFLIAVLVHAWWILEWKFQILIAIHVTTPIPKSENLTFRGCSLSGSYVIWVNQKKNANKKVQIFFFFFNLYHVNILL